MFSNMNNSHRRVGHKGAGTETGEEGWSQGWCVEVPGGSGVPRGHRKWGHRQGWGRGGVDRKVVELCSVMRRQGGWWGGRHVY